MKRIMKLLSVAVIVGMLSGIMSSAVLAATAALTSVTFRVGTDIRAGDRFPISIATSGNSLEVQDGTFASSNSEKYEVYDAEWVSSSTGEKEAAVGDEPRMKIYIRAMGYDSRGREYIFRGGYSASNITIKGGTFVSARVISSGSELEVTVKLSGVKGQFPTPDDAYWKNSGYGNAVWVMDSDNKRLSSGYYDVYLYRSGSIVKRLEAYKGTSYNFYPYMTKKGTYIFKVRTVPQTESEKKYGSKSNWLESGEIYVDESNVSDGSGQTDGNGISSNNSQVGWIKDGTTWYYRYPDGSYQKNSWLKTNNKWYLFDSSGKMLTGWQTRNGQTYFLQNTGDMYVGWLKGGDKWYYLNPTKGDFEGAMSRGWINVDEKVYCMDSNGAMLEGWNKVDDNWYYFYPGSGYKATNTFVGPFEVDENGVWRKQI